MSAQPSSSLRFTLEAAGRVASALAEVLPSDRYRVVAQPGMGHDGVLVELPGAPDGVVTPSWYFDNTYGGVDSFSDPLRVYFAIAEAGWVDDHRPPGAPRVDADPVTFARWIVSVTPRGVPDAPPRAGPLAADGQRRCPVVENGRLPPGVDTVAVGELDGAVTGEHDSPVVAADCSGVTVDV